MKKIPIVKRMHYQLIITIFFQVIKLDFAWFVKIYSKVYKSDRGQEIIGLEGYLKLINQIAGGVEQVDGDCRCQDGPFKPGPAEV